MGQENPNHNYRAVDLAWIAGADSIIKEAEEFLSKIMMEFAADKTPEVPVAFEIDSEDLKCAMFQALSTAGHVSSEAEYIVQYWFKKYWE